MYKKKFLAILFSVLVFSRMSFCQKEAPKGANCIKVIGVTFAEAVNKLLDAGYSIEKSDSVFQTIKTDFKESRTKAKEIELSLFVRIKDSVALITGKTFNSGLIGAKFLGTQLSKEAVTFDIENSTGNFKRVFSEMNDFALSFKRPLEYLKQ